MAAPFHSASEQMYSSLSLRTTECLEVLGSDTSFLEEGSRGGDADLLALVTSDRTRGNGAKLCQGKFRLDIG